MRSSGAFVHSFCYAVAYKVGTEPRDSMSFNVSMDHSMSFNVSMDHSMPFNVSMDHSISFNF
jgi:hypothetical protein